MSCCSCSVVTNYIAHVILFAKPNVLHFYISTFRSVCVCVCVCAVPNLSVLCSSLTSPFHIIIIIIINSTSRTVPGSIPGDVTWNFFPWFLPTKPCVLRSTQPLKMSTRDFSRGKGGLCVWLAIYHPCSAESREDPRP